MQTLHVLDTKIFWIIGYDNASLYTDTVNIYSKKRNLDHSPLSCGTYRVEKIPSVP